MKYMFDTNVFNDILDGNIDFKKFREGIVCCVTHIQRDEINKTKDKMRRKALNDVFSELAEEEHPTKTFVLGISRLGMGKLGEGTLYQQLKDRLDSLNRKKKGNNGMDALIGETAIKNDLTLVTHDMEFFRVMTEFNCATANIYQVIKTHS